MYLGIDEFLSVSILYDSVYNIQLDTTLKRLGDYVNIWKRRILKNKIYYTLILYTSNITYMRHVFNFVPA